MQKIDLPSATNCLGLQPPRDDDDDIDDEVESIRHGEGDSTAYAESLKQEENMAAIRRNLFPDFAPSQSNQDGPGSLYDPEDLTSRGTSAGVNELTKDETVQLYAKFRFDRGKPPDSKLTIHACKDNIVRIIEANQVVIINGPTGCGKTTQVPQYILEHYMKRQKYCNIVVTQPRRIAAISVATRVCKERDWPLGSMVAYQVGLDNICSNDTRLRYVTTGVLLQQLVANKDMNEYTHIFLDEVHERDQDTDFVMLVVKKFLYSNSRAVKVVLMSATAESETFATYMAMPVCGRLEEAPVFPITAQGHPISEFYLDGLGQLQMTLPEVVSDSPGISTEMYNLAVRLITAFDTLEAGGQQVVELPEERGAVLVFLPGLEEINTIHAMLHRDNIKYKWHIIPLHSTVTAEEQQRVFFPPPRGFRKVILSTNICESSVTVPDIIYVVDFCLTKSMFLDTVTNYHSLRLEWASHSNCNQRRGRVGRVAPGRVYRLVPEKFYRECLEHFPTPEMTRCPSEQLVLKAKMLNLGSPCSILGLALDPPTLNDIEKAVLTLKEVLALLTTCEGKFEHHDGDITVMGKIMSTLPVDVHLGKLIILGHVFGCLDDCIVIAAGLSLQSFFSRPFNERMRAYKAKLNWAENSLSDCIAICSAYNVWQTHTRTRYFKRPGGLSEEAWCSSNFIQHKRLRDVERLVRELKDRLSRSDIHSDRKKDRNRVEDWLVLRLVICGAFYPNYFTQGKLDEDTIVRALSGKDPLRSVVISGFPANQGMLYAEEVENMFRQCSELTNINLHFEETRAIVEFGHSAQATSDKKISDIHVIPEVYQAVKMRWSRQPLSCYQLPREEAQRRVDELEYYTKQKEDEKGVKRLRSNRMSSMKINTLPQVPLPGLGCTVVDLFLTNMVDCGHFWAQYKNSESDMTLRSLQASVQACVAASSRPCQGAITPGKILLAPYTAEMEDTVCYYRARVEAVDSQFVEVFFVDFGNRSKLRKGSLRDIDEETFPKLLTTPMLAIECKLANIIKPGGSDNPYSEEARVHFLTVTKDRKLTGRVYSVMYDTVRLELFVQRDGVEVSINDELIQLRYAVHFDEPLVSKQNHEIRMRVDASDPHSMAHSSYDDARLLPHTLSWNSGNPSSDKSRKLMQLQGPTSPLEMVFFSLQKRMMVGSVRVDPDSINSVALDPEPHDTHERLLVAAQVSTNPTGTALTARNTTLLPNVHGLLSSVCLLFAPMAELRCDRAHKRYTGAICGLGCDDRGRSLYPEHDMEVEFDTVFDHDDLCAVNIIRYGINLMMEGHRENGSLRLNTEFTQNLARKHLLKLVFRFKESMPKMMSGKSRWKAFEGYKYTTIVTEEEERVEQVLLHPIDGIRLEGVKVPQSMSFESNDDTSSVVSSMDLDNL